jgi:hypothetical protein
MRHLLVVVSAFFVVILLASCSGQEKLDVAEGGVAEFHRQLAAGAIHEMYAAASPKLKEATTEADFTKLLTAIRSKLGQVTQANRTGWNLNYHTSGIFVTLTYDTQFQQGKAAERFVFQIMKERAALVSYNINSNDLMTK